MMKLIKAAVYLILVNLNIVIKGELVEVSLCYGIIDIMVKRVLL